MTDPHPDEPTSPTSEQPRFLARTGRHGTYRRLPPTTPTDLGRWEYVEADDDTADDLGYTTTPHLGLHREPECVGPAILDDYTQVNRRIYTQQHVLEVAEAQQRRPDLTPQNRHDTLRARAKAAHVDISHELHLIQKAIDKARMRERDIAPRALERLVNLEALLDGVSIRRMAA